MKLNVHYEAGSDSKTRNICRHYWETGGNARAEPFTYKVKWIVDNFGLSSSTELRNIVENNSYASIPDITCIDCGKEIPATTRTKIKILICKGSHACESCAKQRSVKIKEAQDAESVSIEPPPQMQAQESIIKKWRSIQDQKKPSIFEINEYQKVLIVIIHNSLLRGSADELLYSEKSPNTRLSPSLYTDRQILKELINNNILLYRTDSPYQEIKTDTPASHAVPIEMKLDLAFSNDQVKAMQNSLQSMEFISRLISNNAYLQKALELQSEMVVSAYLSLLENYDLKALHENEIRRLAREFVVQIPPRVIVSVISNTAHSHLNHINKTGTKEQLRLASAALYNEIHHKLSALANNEYFEDFNEVENSTSSQFKSEASVILFDNIYRISNAGYNYTCSDLIKQKITRLNKEKDLKNLASLYGSILDEQPDADFS